MNMEAVFRAEQPGDERAIRELLVDAFPDQQEAALVEQLRQNGRLSISLVATSADRVIGHIAFSRVKIVGSRETADGAGLAPLAVHPEFRKRGIAFSLVSLGLSECRRLHIGFVVVLGEPEYYSRFGFSKASLRGVANAYGADDSFLLIELMSGSVQPGQVRYSPEFDALSLEHATDARRD